MTHDDTTREPVPTALRIAHDVLDVHRAFGRAYERDGTLVVPVARVMGGGGGGAGTEGTGPDRETDEGSAPSRGEGGGLRTHVRPLGVYVVDERGTRWVPALDLNRVVLGGQVVAVVAALVTGWVLGRRSGR